MSSATGHWWVQRLSALALIPLCLWAVWVGVTVAGMEHAAATAWLGRPVQALLAVVTAAVVLYHTLLGVQVVIEDYVPGPGLASGLLWFARLGCLAGVLAVAWAGWRLAFGA